MIKPEVYRFNRTRAKLDVGEGELPITYIELAPDLAVEVISPSDRSPEVRDKVEDWLRAGTRLVWVIYPATRSATVYRSLEDFENLSEEDKCSRCHQPEPN